MQLWIEQGSRPVPIRVAIEYLSESGTPQFKATFTNWTLSSSTPNESFDFSPPPDAERLLARTIANTADDEGGK